MRTILKAAGAVALAAVLATSAYAADKLKVAFIYVGPIGDFGYNYQHNAGRLQIDKELGDKVETTYLDNVAEADSDRTIEQLVRAGNKLIFATSFGFMEPVLKVAAKYPNVYFEHATGYKRSKNVSTYSAKFHEGRYVQGVIAGKMTKSNIIGYIGSFPIPEVVSGINAFMLGAQSVNPNIKVKVVWVNTWIDPGKEADAAKALLDQGADIITQHTDSPAPVQQAEARGKFAFGQATDVIKFAPKNVYTSIVDNWGGYYVARTKAGLDGTWKSTDTWGGFDTGMVKMAPFTNMPDDVKKLATDTEAAIKAGKLNPFKCPVYGQDGKEIECKGKGALDDGQILGMNFYVKGIDDKLPQ